MHLRLQFEHQSRLKPFNLNNLKHNSKVQNVFEVNFKPCIGNIRDLKDLDEKKM